MLLSKGFEDVLGQNRPIIESKSAVGQTRVNERSRRIEGQRKWRKEKGEKLNAGQSLVLMILALMATYNWRLKGSI